MMAESSSWPKSKREAPTTTRTEMKRQVPDLSHKPHSTRVGVNFLPISNGHVVFSQHTTVAALSSRLLTSLHRELKVSQEEVEIHHSYLNERTWFHFRRHMSSESSAPPQQKEEPSELRQRKTTTTKPQSSDDHDMPTYAGRRNFAYSSRVTTPTSSAVLPAPMKGNSSLASYRKKFFSILAVTCLYTAFLYNRGQSVKLCCCSRFISIICAASSFSRLPWMWICPFNYVVSKRICHASSISILYWFRLNSHIPFLFLSLILLGGASTYLGSSVVPDPQTIKAAKKGLKSMLTAGRRLSVATWNIAAINNNPFEYWITYKENPAYEQLMIDIEKFLESPGDKDVKVNQVFTDEMFNKLDSRLTGVGWKSVRSYWESDFQHRQIISGFMKVCNYGSDTHNYHDLDNLEMDAFQQIGII